jgi:hypothetical protein
MGKGGGLIIFPLGNVLPEESRSKRRGETTPSVVVVLVINNNDRP